MCPCPFRENPVPHLHIARVLCLSLCPDRLCLVAQEDLTVLRACLQTTQDTGELTVAEDRPDETVL